MKPQIAFLLLFIFFTCNACYEDHCFDVDKIAQHRKEVRGWIPPSENTTWKSKSNSEYFSISQTDGISSGITQSDDCGRSFVDFEKIISLENQQLAINFKIHLKASGENDYYLALETQSANPKSITYDFISKSGIEQASEVEILPDFTLNKVVYSEVMHFKFLKKLNPNELKELFYAKGVGIIKFSTESGSEFIVK
jgi:hypothetical protein